MHCTASAGQHRISNRIANYPPDQTQRTVAVAPESEGRENIRLESAVVDNSLALVDTIPRHWLSRT